MSLEMRGIRERCGTGLAPDGPAFICSHEFTSRSRSLTRRGTLFAKASISAGG